MSQDEMQEEIQEEIKIGKADPQPSRPSFPDYTPYPVGTSPIAVAVGNFTNDGNLDIVTANYHDNSITVLLGNGDGTFQEGSVPYPVGTSPIAVAVGDFTKNGTMDIAFINEGDNAAWVLLSNGDGTFQPPQSYPIGYSPIAIAVGDYYHDGNLAIITANKDINSVTILQGNGDGTFQSPQSSSVATQPLAVAVADFNNDGLPDIVFTSKDASGGNAVYIGFNNGDGNAPSNFLRYAVGSYPIAVAVGDFTNDGNLDIVTANYHDNSVTVLLGNGDGTFQAPKTFPVGLGPVAVAVGDFTNDGVLDIVTANAFDDTISVLQGKGDGTFVLYQFYPTGAYPQSVAVGDFYYGGGLDGIVTADFSANTATVLLPGPPPLDVQVSTIYPTLNEPFNTSVATIRGARGASDTTATIDWGDFTPQTPGTVSDNGDGTLTVSGAHTYVDTREDTFILTVSADDGVRSGVGKGQAILTSYSSLTVQVNYIQATATVPFNGAVATITGASSSSDTTSTIDWGDGTSETPGTLVANNDGTLTVNGTHTYSQARTYWLVVTATEGDNFASNPGFAFVKSATAVQFVQVNTIQAIAQELFRGTVATISGIRSASDTTVMIDWGDGTAMTPGTVMARLDGTWSVRGSHTYSRGGTFPVTVTVKEGARTATGRDRAIVEVARVKVARLHARAFGVQRLTPPQGPFGDVSIPSTGGTRTVTVPSVRLPGNGLRVRAITDRVSGTLTPTPALASASSAIGELHGFGITALGITATAHADQSRPRGLRGTTTFASLSVGNTTFPPNFTPAANRVIPFADGSGTVTLNEQTLTRRANGLLIVVNALHLQITHGPHAGTDIVVGHVEAGIAFS